eukprot:2617198-Pleurochrysis_carterae.AAC.2
MKRACAGPRPFSECSTGHPRRRGRRRRRLSQPAPQPADVHDGVVVCLEHSVEMRDAQRPTQRFDRLVHQARVTLSRARQHNRVAKHHVQTRMATHV